MGIIDRYKSGILTAVIFLGFIIRLYGITMPLIESHQVRQAQAAVMARNLYEDKMNIFRTRLDFFGQTPGYVILEFPLMHGITALLYYLFGVHEIIGRLVSVIFSIGTMFLVYGLARQFLSVSGAFAALILYSFSPMNIFFSRAFMAESSMLFFMVGAIYFFLKWLDKQTLNLYLMAIIFALFACLTKPTAAIIFAPILTAWFLKTKWNLLKRFDFWLYILLTMAPAVFWAVYANYFNSKLPYCTYGFGDSWMEILRTRGIIRHWFSYKFYAFVGGSIIFLLLTPFGFIGTVSGVFYTKKNKRAKILYSWLAAIIAYFYILAGPNSGHIYYHLHLLPLAVIFFGFSIEWTLSRYELIKEKFFKRKAVVWGGTVFLFLIFLGYGIGYLKYFNYMYSNRMPYVLEVSEIIKKNVADNRLIIDNGSGLLTSVISYYSHSKVQPFTMSGSSVSELEKLRSLGATTFVTMETAYGSSVKATKEDKDFWNYLSKNYKALAVTEHYLIFDLRGYLSRSNENTNS